MRNPVTSPSSLDLGLSRTTRSGPAWELLVLTLVLLVPVVVCLLVSDGLRLHIKTFHSSDEFDYHLPIIRDFASSFPRMDLRDYNSATTPLFHIIMASVAQVFGVSLPVLRGVNLAATVLVGVGVFCTFRFVMLVDFATTICVALAFTLSPYVLGSGLVLLTDNIALAFCVASLFFGLRARDRTDLAMAALLACLAILTRQLYVWLVPVMVVGAVMARARAGAWRDAWRTAALSVALGGLALLPYGVLCLVWGGTNPPRFQFFRSLNPGAVPFMLANLGLYAGPLLLAGRHEAFARVWRAPRRVALIGVGAAALLLLAPLRPVGLVPCPPADPTCPLPTDGFLWCFAHKLPAVAGSSILFWVLVPVGIAALMVAWRDAGPRAPSLWVAAFALPLLIANASPFQKYYDPIALLIGFLLVFGPRPFAPARSRAVLGAYMLLFTAYFAKSAFL